MSSVLKIMNFSNEIAHLPKSKGDVTLNSISIRRRYIPCNESVDPNTFKPARMRLGLLFLDLFAFTSASHDFSNLVPNIVALC